MLWIQYLFLAIKATGYSNVDVTVKHIEMVNIRAKGLESEHEYFLSSILKLVNTFFNSK